MTDEIETIRCIAPDTDNGGKLVGGVITGPRISVCRWQIKGENRLYESRPEIERELKRRQFNTDIFDALKLTSKDLLPPSEIAKLIRANGKAVRAVLGQKKYMSLLS